MVEKLITVLIPLLLDDPLWAEKHFTHNVRSIYVLIPLLLDDPLWVVVHYESYIEIMS